MNNEPASGRTLSLLFVLGLLGAYAVQSIGCGGSSPVHPGDPSGSGGSLVTGGGGSTDESTDSGTGGTGGTGETGSNFGGFSGFGGFGFGGFTETGSGGADCHDDGSDNHNEEHALIIDDGVGMDCGDDNVQTLTGSVLAGDQADWFRYAATDGTFSSVGPMVQVTPADAVTSLRACIFVDCIHGDSTDVTCPAGTVAETSAEGRFGCCGSDAFTIDVNCTGTTDETSDVFIRVDDPTDSNVCMPYTVTWHC